MIRRKQNSTEKPLGFSWGSRQSSHFSYSIQIYDWVLFSDGWLYWQYSQGESLQYLCSSFSFFSFQLHIWGLMLGFAWKRTWVLNFNFFNWNILKRVRLIQYWNYEKPPCFNGFKHLVSTPGASPPPPGNNLGVLHLLKISVNLL